MSMCGRGAVGELWRWSVHGGRDCGIVGRCCAVGAYGEGDDWLKLGDARGGVVWGDSWAGGVGGGEARRWFAGGGWLKGPAVGGGGERGGSHPKGGAVGGGSGAGRGG